MDDGNVPAWFLTIVVPAFGVLTSAIGLLFHALINSKNEIVALQKQLREQDRAQAEQQLQIERQYREESVKIERQYREEAVRVERAHGERVALMLQGQVEIAEEVRELLKIGATDRAALPPAPSTGEGHAPRKARERSDRSGS